MADTTIIQHRRGQYVNFDPQKMKPAELAVVQGGDPISSDGKGVYVAIQAGDVKRLATMDDMTDEINSVTDNIVEQVHEAADEILESVPQIQQNTSDIADLKADLNVKTPIQYYLDHYVDLHVEPVNIDNLPETTTPGEKCAVVDCVPGDRFIINAVGGGWGRAWGFLDSSNMIISRADPKVTVEGLELIAPANAVKLCINDHGGMLSYKILGNVSDVVADLVIEQEKDGITDDIRSALLACFEHTAWIDESGQSYYESLKTALYANSYPKLVATFTQGDHIVYTDDELSTLVPYLVVKLFENVDDPGTVIASSDYTLSGTLRAGQSVVTVIYGDASTTFTLTAIDYYNIWRWNYPGAYLTKLSAGGNPNMNAVATRITLNDSELRRTFVGVHGKAPYYYNGVESQYYPIPIPSSASKIKIESNLPETYVYMHTVPLNNNSYGDSILANRVTWTALPVEKALTNEGNVYVIINLKYTSSGTSFPSEPEIAITFSEE